MFGNDRTPEDRRREEEKRRQRREAEALKRQHRERNAEQRREAGTAGKHREQPSGGETGEQRRDRKTRPADPPRRNRPAHNPVVKRRRLVLAAIPLIALLVVVSLIAFAGGKDAPNQVTADPNIEQRKEQARRIARQRASEDRAIHRLLNDTTFIASGGGQRREVALTFDDGPGPATEKILDILARTSTPATFFVVGTSVPDNEETLQRVAREGHAIGNHTMEHPPMGTLDLASQGEQITGQEEQVERAGVENRAIFRPPYRSFNQGTLDLLRERDELMVLWSVDTNDYGNPGTDAIVQAILNDSQPGSIILMHDAGGDRQQTVEALPDIIHGLRAKGLKPVTIPQMVRRDPPMNADRYPEGL